MPADAEKRFVEKFAGDLTPGQIRQRVRWYELGGCSPPFAIYRYSPSTTSPPTI